MCPVCSAWAFAPGINWANGGARFTARLATAPDIAPGRSRPSLLAGANSPVGSVTVASHIHYEITGVCEDNMRRDHRRIQVNIRGQWTSKVVAPSPAGEFKALFSCAKR